MMTANNPEPSEIELLLPFHAAGALSQHEAQQVEAALAKDPELARRYEWVREELAQETHINEAAGEPSPRDVKVLFAKIDAEPARRPRASINLASINLAPIDLGSRIAEFFASLSPRTLAWSAAAAALAIVLQAGVIAGIVLKPQNTGGYETASAPTSTAGEGAQLLIRFQPQAAAADVAGFLETNKLSIVGGPSAGGLYRVRVGSAKLAKDDLVRIVKTLQNDKVIGFIAITD